MPARRWSSSSGSTKVADSYEDLGTHPRFPHAPNWSRAPGTSLTLPRRILEFRGSAQEIAALTPDVPLSFEAEFTCVDKAEEHAVVDFFNARKGRCEPFWVAHPRRHFTLKEAANAGALVLNVAPNSAELQFQGYERIFLEMANGDVVTRHVYEAAFNEVQARVELSLETALDRDVTPENHVAFGRYLLARFDDDVLKERVLTDGVSAIALRFVEVVGEYA